MRGNGSASGSKPELIQAILFFISVIIFIIFILFLYSAHR
jgi:hypothetical protein